MSLRWEEREGKNRTGDPFGSFLGGDVASKGSLDTIGAGLAFDLANEVLPHRGCARRELGGQSETFFVEKWREKGGLIVHLTMYGINVDDIVGTIRGLNKDILIIIGHPADFMRHNLPNRQNKIETALN